MERMLPGEALILFRWGLTPYETLQVVVSLKQFQAAGSPWFPTDLGYFVGFIKGYRPMKNNVAWRGTYSFQKGVKPA